MTHFSYDLHCDEFRSEFSVLILLNLSAAFDTNYPVLLSDILDSQNYQNQTLLDSFLNHWSLLLSFICWYPLDF